MGTLLRLGRATILTAAITATSGLPDIMDTPLFAALGEATINLVAVQSETERLRRKVAGAASRLPQQALLLLKGAPHQNDQSFVR